MVLIGNSNVGKSTIARYFLKNKKLTTGAIGKHAGSTVSLKLYDDPSVPYQIVDLPGFGAMTRTSKDLKDKIHTEIINYIERDKSNIFLIMVIVNGIRIMDELEKWYYQDETTIPLTFEFISWIENIQLPCIMVINKIDRLKHKELDQILHEIDKILTDIHIQVKGNISKGLLKIFTVSAKKEMNMGKLQSFVEEIWNMMNTG
ncbi:MAG: 50S ribosome-binding GTPase [Candidatus Lokiarchaeota archaeon]|nr:50S ribosome-binding GTPase [Candidatus Lokiarchaeota archaeon]